MEATRQVRGFSEWPKQRGQLLRERVMRNLCGPRKSPCGRARSLTLADLADPRAGSELCCGGW
eukprot:4414951-Amphidinium_carterae.2